MPVDLVPALAAYIPRDRVMNILHPERPLTQDGVALIADISGFTPLTEALTHGLSPDRGAEELTRALDSVFTPLIAEIHAFGGNVIKFGGDALIVWFGRSGRGWKTAVIRRALTAAWRMQQAIKLHGQAPTPIGVVTLQMKIGFTYGPVKRFNLGLPEYGYEDVLAGATLDRMADAEHHAQPGEIIADKTTLDYLADALAVSEWRDGFGVVGRLLHPARRHTLLPWHWPPPKEDELVKALAPYLPRQIYEMLLAGRSQVAELKPVLSLFAQFHGVDYDDDLDVAQKLQTYFVTAQRVVARYDGRLNRLITGDKGSLLHVIFGAPRSVEEQEARAVRCALDLQTECGRLPFIRMQRIGMTMGRVFAGPVGSPDRHDYTTMGDAINLSARLMQHAADDQVLMETAVRQHLGPEFDVTDLGPIRVKGKSEPVGVFAALSAQPTHRQRTQAATEPIFGRDEETAVLQQKLSELAAGQGGVVTLAGEVGMGKTLLLDALRAQSQLTWASGVSLAYGQTLSGYLFIDLIRDLLDLPPGAGPDQTSQQLSQFCTDLFGADRLEATYPYLARFMGLPLAGELAQRLQGLAGESLRWQLFELLPELMRYVGGRRPVVLALDDLQWADPTSLQLVESLLPVAAQAPMLLILAMRPEQTSPAWELRGRAMGMETAVHLTLHPLNETAAHNLIAHHAPDLPPRVVDYLVEKGAGSPLFLVEADDIPAITLVPFPGFSTAPEYLRDSWRRELGLEVTVAEMPADQALSGLREGTVHLVLFAWHATYPDPDDVLRSLFHSQSPINYFGWHNEQFDGLVDGAAGASDLHERMSLYHEADRVLVAQETAVLPLYYYQVYGLLRPQFSLADSGRIIRGNLIKFKNIMTRENMDW